MKIPNGLLIRNGSQLNSLPSKNNGFMGVKTSINEAKSNKDIKTVNDLTPNSNGMKSSLMRSSDLISANNDLISGGMGSERGMIKESIMLPQYSKDTINKGGFIHLKADFKKK